MELIDALQDIWVYIAQIDLLEAGGLVFGLACVILLIRENIWTWPMGIIYVLISFVIFWQAKLYADFVLHIFFLALNIYGWYFWVKGRDREDEALPVTASSFRILGILLVISAIGVVFFGTLLDQYTDASLAYWDSATSVLSIAGMWLTAKKKIENWYFWLVVDVLATGIYIYKGIYFYVLRYLIYIGLAISGLLSWKKSMDQAQALAR